MKNQQKHIKEKLGKKLFLAGDFQGAAKYYLEAYKTSNNPNHKSAANLAEATLLFQQELIDEAKDKCNQITPTTTDDWVISNVYYLECQIASNHARKKLGSTEHNANDN